MKKIINILMGSILILIILTSCSTTQKVSNSGIYKNNENKELIYRLYDDKLAKWEVPYEIIEVPTKYGKTNIIASGEVNNPPVFLLHPMGLTATVWQPNVAELSRKYRVYAINTIGDIGKSELHDFNYYPKKGKDWSDWLNEVMNGLQIDKCNVVAASMGGWIAMNFAIHSPDRVNRLVLLGPAGIKSSVFKLMRKFSKVMFYPSQKNKEALTKWVLGDSKEVNKELAVYMNTALNCEGRIPYPNRIKTKQLETIEAKTMLILGEFDNVIGNPNKNEKYAKKHFKDLEIEFVRTGHIIGMESPAQINPTIINFLGN